jgi:hypothetical protein
MPTPRRTKPAPASFLDLTSRLRGIYERVARRLRLDPSYVSRVARGERRSKAVKVALRQELRRILAGKIKVARKAKK